jgi:D-glycero-D-manno-heptose 1,7-bisphosphate phosphatase
MLRQAAAELGLDLSRSYLVGDKLSDLEAGAQAGTQTILVRSGHGRAVPEAALDHARLNLVGVAADLAGAVDLFLGRWREWGAAAISQSSG